MQYNHSTSTAQPQRDVLQTPTTSHNAALPGISNSASCVDQISDSLPESASTNSTSDATELTGGNTGNLQAAVPLELARYSQQKGPAEVQQRNPRVSGVYPYAMNNDVQHIPREPVRQGMSSVQFENGVSASQPNLNFRDNSRMANMNVQHLTNSFAQVVTPFNALAQFQQTPNNPQYTGHGFHPSLNSLPMQMPNFINIYSANAPSNPIMQWQGRNGMTTLGVPPNWPVENQLNSQWNRVNTSVAHPAFQSQMALQRSRFAHVQGQTQMSNPLQSLANVPITGGSLSSQENEPKPAFLEYLERTYGINVRPEDYSVMKQLLSGLPKVGHHSDNSGYIQNAHTNGETPSESSLGDGEGAQDLISSKRKREDDNDENIGSAKRLRRRRQWVSALAPKSENLPSGSSTSPPAPSWDSILDDKGDPEEVFFAFTRRGTRSGFCCQYQHPFDKSICNAFIAVGDKRNRYRHLALHVQEEEDYIQKRVLAKEDAVMLARLQKMVVECEHCDFKKEVWRTDYVRENHEKKVHPDVYSRRLQDKENKKGRKTKKKTQEAAPAQAEEQGKGKGKEA